MVFTLIHLDQRHDEENEYNDDYAVEAIVRTSRMNI